MTETIDTSPTPAPGPPEQLGHIQADRPCARCGFNLFGQPISRDPHYQMPVATCSECGQVVALQEYPGLGVWWRRWSAMLAAAWLGLAVCYLIFTFTMTTAPVSGVMESSHQRLTNSILSMYLEDNPSMERNNIRPWAGLPASWLDAQDLPARVRESGSIASQLDPQFGVAVVTLGLMTYAVALPWPVLALGSSRLKVGVYFAVLLAVSAVLLALIERDSSASDTSPDGLAMGVAWPTMLLLIYPALAIAGLAAAFTGRPLARLVIRAALPPRLRLPFAELWRADGKSMPQVTGR